VAGIEPEDRRFCCSIWISRSDKPLVGGLLPATPPQAAAALLPAAGAVAVAAALPRMAMDGERLFETNSARDSLIPPLLLPPLLPTLLATGGVLPQAEAAAAAAAVELFLVTGLLPKSPGPA
jgi:hypothetical protein